MIIKLKADVSAPLEENVRHFQSGVSIYNGNTFLGTGNLYISEETLTWINLEDNSGINFSYFDISCHAISTDQSHFDHPCIYMMVQADNFMDTPEQESNTLEEEEEDDPDRGVFEEIRLVPENPQSLQLLYNLICECQILNPDEPDLERELFED